VAFDYSTYQGRTSISSINKIEKFFIDSGKKNIVQMIDNYSTYGIKYFATGRAISGHGEELIPDNIICKIIKYNPHLEADNLKWFDFACPYSVIKYATINNDNNLLARLACHNTTFFSDFIQVQNHALMGFMIKNDINGIKGVLFTHECDQKLKQRILENPELFIDHAFINEISKGSSPYIDSLSRSLAFGTPETAKEIESINFIDYRQVALRCCCYEGNYDTFLYATKKLGKMCKYFIIEEATKNDRVDIANYIINNEEFDQTQMITLLGTSIDYKSKDKYISIEVYMYLLVSLIANSNYQSNYCRSMGETKLKLVMILNFLVSIPKKSLKYIQLLTLIINQTIVDPWAKQSSNL
jgi:hypothetical protein